MSETAKQEQQPKKDMKDVLAAVEGLKCGIQRAQKFVEEFLSEPMCGRCLPCSLGSYEALVRLKLISANRGTEADVSAIRRIADQMAEGSMCKKGKDTAAFIHEALKTEIFREHLNGACRDRECPSYIMYRVIADKCVMCGDCKDACRYDAVIGEKRVSYRGGYPPFEIRQKRCVKCGDCLKACRYGAVEVVEEKSGVLV